MLFGMIATVALLLAPIACQAAGTQVGDIEFVTRRVAVGGTPGDGLATGDLNGDGHADLLVANESHVTILLGHGTGAFTLASRVPAGENPTDMAPGDFDEDGHLDVAIANHETRYVTLLLGDGDGGLRAAPNSPLAIDVDPHPHAVRAADVDGDGHTDLVVDHRSGRGLLIIKGAGDGTFDAGRLVPGGGDPYRGLAIGDVDGDGDLDLLTPNPSDVGVILATDARRLEYAPPGRVRAPDPWAIDLVDLTGDGRLDLVVGSERGDAVRVLVGDGRAGFREREDLAVPFPAGGKKIVLGDFDGDGRPDAAVTTWFAAEVLLILGDADTVRTARLPGAADSYGIATADFNGDGVDDLAIADGGSDEVIVHVSRRR